MNTAVTAALGLASALAGGFVLAVHLGFRAPRRLEQGTPLAFGLPFESLAIPTTAGHGLFGWWIPAADEGPTAVVLHGWGSNAELMLPLAAPLHRAGLNVLLFDAHNHGRSPAALVSSMPGFARDLDAALAWLRHRRPRAARRVVLVGHSVGAAAVVLCASRRRDLSAVISLASFAHPLWLTERALGRLRLPRPVVLATVRYVEWVIGHRFADIAPLHRLCAVRCPVLLVHGRADRVIPFSDAEALLAHCREPHVRLLEIADADHASIDKIEEHGGALLEFLVATGVLGMSVGAARPASGTLAATAAIAAV